MATLLEGYNRRPLDSVDQSDVRQIVEWTHGGFPALPTCDADTNRFLRRQLEFIMPQLVDFKYAPISARTVLPVERNGGSGAELITWRQRTHVAKAKIVGDYADDVPKANVFAEEFSSKVRSLACETAWSLQEIRNASMANVNLSAEDAFAAREAILRLENDIAWNGDAVNGLIGVLTTPNIPTTVAPNGGGGNPQWSTKTGAEIVADLNFLVNSVFEATNQVERANTILLPTEQYHIAINTRMETGTDTTAMQFFVNNSPYIASVNDVIPINELNGAGAGGVDIAIAYRKDPMKLAMQVPFDIESLAPEIRGFMTSVIYHSRAGGVIVKKPLSLYILTTI